MPLPFQRDRSQIFCWAEYNISKERDSGGEGAKRAKLLDGAGLIKRNPVLKEGCSQKTWRKAVRVCLEETEEIQLATRERAPRVETLPIVCVCACVLSISTLHLSPLRAFE